MTDAPERIWLSEQPDYWQNNLGTVFTFRNGSHEVEYVRADLATPAPAVKVKALVWEPDELGWKAKGAAKEYTVYRESQKRTADADNRERVLVWVEEPNSILSQSANTLDDPRVKALVKKARAVVDRWDSPLWKDLPHTGESIDELRAALSALEENK